MTFLTSHVVTKKYKIKYKTNESRMTPRYYQTTDDDVDDETPNTSNSIEEHTHSTNSDLTGVAYKQESSANANDNVTFYEFFRTSYGPPQIVFVCLLLALSFGSVIGLVPAVMTDRLARTHYGYEDEIACFEVTENKPDACTKGSNLAQDYAAFCSLVSNFMTFLTSALIGSISDTIGRKSLLSMGIFLSILPSMALILIQIFDGVSPLWYYGLGSLGGLINWIAIAISSLSDVIPKHFRAGSFVSVTILIIHILSILFLV